MLQIQNNSTNKILGWEKSIHQDSLTIKQRMLLNSNEIKASILGLAVLLLIFIISCWLASNPFENTQRIGAAALEQYQSLNSEQWRIIWPVAILAILFEFLDSAAGMGYGTAFTPLLLLMGFDPMQIIPVIMIQQACAGLVSAYIHKEYGNVEWHFSPPSETVRLLFAIAVMGILAVVASITSFYGILKLDQIWIKLYVVILLLGMGLFALFNPKKSSTYHPNRMYFFGALAGFNKGIGGGGYGPVVTIGGLLSGIPAKSMMAVTAFSEGLVCIVSICVWFYWLSQGMVIDFLLLPSMLLGSIVAVIAAPYATRVLPEKIWQSLVPAYCCVIGAICFWKLYPNLINLLS